MSGAQLDLEPITWFDAETQRFEEENARLATVAPALRWKPRAGAGGSWVGELPVWPFDRAAPAGLHTLVRRGLRVHIECSAAHPMVMPGVHPLRPKPSLAYRTSHAWHISGDGSLCLLQSAAAWSGEDFVADTAIKSSGWFIEYKLMVAHSVDKMTLGGIATSDALDDMIVRAIAEAGGR